MAESPEASFWKWFEENDRALFEFEAEQERIFALLARELGKVHPDLTFEFGPKQKVGWREFVISAGGIKAAFPAVESLFSGAPELDRWKFTKFRPRRAPMIIEIGGRSVEPEEVHFRLFRDGDEIGIMLFFDGYTESERNFFGNAGFLLLDQALGEYTVETQVGFIVFADRNSKYFDAELSLPELAGEFDKALDTRGYKN